MSARLVRATQLIGRPVITLDTATAVGELRDILIDPVRSRLIGFTVRGRGLLSPALLGILPADSIAAIGRDAVMISAAGMVISERAGMQQLLADQEEVIGKEVLGSAGTSLGVIADVVLEVEDASARVVGYELTVSNGSPRIVPVEEPVAMSAQALVLPEDARDHETNGLASLRHELQHDRR